MCPRQEYACLGYGAAEGGGQCARSGANERRVRGDEGGPRQGLWGSQLT